MATLQSVPPGVASTPGGRTTPAPRSNSWRVAVLVIRRIVGALISLFALIVFNFFLFRLGKTDPARILGRNRHLSTEAVESLRHRFGLDQGLWSQFGHYLNRLLLHADQGQSIAYPSQTVTSVIASHIWPTVLLVGTSTILSAWIGVWIGIRGAWERGSAFDRASNA